MRTIKNLLWALLPIFALTMVGCGEDPVDGPNTPVIKKDSTIKLEKSKVDVGLAGGTFVMTYKIENAHAGEKITFEAAESWVNNFNDITGAFSFDVDANDTSSERQCLVTVKYRYAEDAVFVVKQGAKNRSGYMADKKLWSSDKRTAGAGLPRHQTHQGTPAGM